MTIAIKYVKTTTDNGDIGEYHYDEEDRLHRDDGPAVVERKADGSLTEKFYRHGQLFRPSPPLPVVVERNVAVDSVTEHYACEDGTINRIVTTHGRQSPFRSRERLSP